MNRRTTCAAILAVILGSGLCLGWADGPAMSSLASAVSPETHLAKLMWRIRTGLRKVGLHATKGESEKLLRMVWRVQEDAVAAKSELPARTSEVPAECREAFIREYRKRMNQLIRALLDLEIAALEGNHSAVLEQVAALKKIEEEGHARCRDE